MQPRLATSTRLHNQLVAFLDSHAGVSYNDDVGPLFGQASVIRDYGVADAQTRRFWNQAVNVAVSSEAIRESRSPRRSI